MSTVATATRWVVSASRPPAEPRVSTGMTAAPRLLIDIGGTNARLALQAVPRGPLLAMATYPCARFDGVQALIEFYLGEHGGPRTRQCAIGIASPIRGDEVVMTNLAWRFSRVELQSALGLDRLVVLNDFTALALALPLLGPDERVQVGGGAALEGAACALLGAGTGLGVGGLLPAPGGGWSAIAGEGGHVTLAGGDDWEDAVLRALRQRFGHASAERVLSGPGIENLYRAGCEVAGQSAEPIDAAEITRRALAASDPACGQCLDLFFALLGSVAGNLALTLGAQGGVYVGGGIVPALGEAITRSSFRTRFEAKGRYAEYLRSIPTWVIHAQSPPALRGAAQALD